MSDDFRELFGFLAPLIKKFDGTKIVIEEDIIDNRDVFYLVVEEGWKSPTRIATIYSSKEYSASDFADFITMIIDEFYVLDINEIESDETPNALLAAGFVVKSMTDALQRNDMETLQSLVNVLSGILG